VRCGNRYERPGDRSAELTQLLDLSGRHRIKFNAVTLNTHALRISMEDSSGIFQSPRGEAPRPSHLLVRTSPFHLTADP
jgi:hypothetical protein